MGISLKVKLNCLNVKIAMVCVLLLCLPVSSLLDNRNGNGKEITWWNRFKFPRHVQLKIEPSISINRPKESFISSVAVQFPVILKFDQLGWPNFFNLMENSIYPGIQILRRSRRESKLYCPRRFSNGTTECVMNKEFQPGQKSTGVDFYHPGGERAAIFETLSQSLESFGLNLSKPCILRLVCEIHEEPLTHYGLFGEIVTLLFTVSKSKFAKTKHLQEYLLAERRGQQGQCAKYNNDCTTSVFHKHHYSDYYAH